MWILVGDLTLCWSSLIHIGRDKQMILKARGLVLTGLVTLLLEKMTAIKYIWSRLLINRRKRQLREDFVLLQRPLTSNYVLLDQSDSVTHSRLNFSSVPRNGPWSISSLIRSQNTGKCLQFLFRPWLVFAFVLLFLLTAVFPPAILIFQ